jgi:hypothetical protein
MHLDHVAFLLEGKYMQIFRELIDDAREIDLALQPSVD